MAIAERLQAPDSYKYPEEFRVSFFPETPVSEEFVAASVDNGFSKNGIPFAPEQRNEFQRGTKTLRSWKQRPVILDMEPSAASLKEYRDTFGYIYKLYGLDKRAVKLGLLEGVMMSRAVLGQLTGPVIQKRVRGMFTGSSSVSASGEKRKSQKMNVKEKAAFLSEVRKLALFVCGTMVGVMSATVLEGAARKAYENEALSFRKAINDRVSDSIFMRDFEFIQDKTPSEILNIIDRGKQGVMTVINETFTQIIPHMTSIAAAAGGGFGVDRVGGALGLLRLPLLYVTNKRVAEQLLADRKTELAQKDAIDARIITSLQSVELVKTSDTIENAIHELGTTMQDQDIIITESKKKRVTRGQQEAYFDVLFEDILPLALGYAEYSRLAENLEFGEAGVVALQHYRTIAAGERSIGGHATALMRSFSERIQPALQDIQRMEALLGPYDALDKPDGLLEQGRKPVSELPNFDIRVQNLHFKNILHNVSVDIPEGSFVTFKGPSGIGKTTLMRHLLGLYGAPKGTVMYGGHDLGSIKKYGEHSVYSKLAYANQNPQYFENMTLRQNLLLWTKKRVDDDTVNQVLHDLHLDHIADRLDSKAKHFSGGELRRIGLARALLKDPKVLFLDEPTSSLDQASAKQVLEIIKEMRRKRPEMTVVAVTHDPSFEAIAEQIVDFAEITTPRPHGRGFYTFAINNPRDTQAESLGNRQALYAVPSVSPT